MASKGKPCIFFQLGKCNKGHSCPFTHVVDPTFKRRPCYHFSKGRCNKGKQCTFSHDLTDTATDVQTSAATVTSNTAERLREFRWKIPKSAAATQPLASALGAFVNQAYELVVSDVGTAQEVLTLLTTEGGMSRINELLDRPFDTKITFQRTRMLNNELLPFLRLLAHSHVADSMLLRPKVMTIYNIMYASDIGGHRVLTIFTSMSQHLSSLTAAPTESKVIALEQDALVAIDATCAVFARLVEVNTPAHTNPRCEAIVEALGELMTKLPEKTQFDLRHARRNLEILQQRLGTAQSVPAAQSAKKTSTARAVFRLARDMPGELSEEGPRHDNDHVDIREISILPTMQEINSSRNEYLPFADPHEWHFGGVAGLVDRHFRLLREDTVGQVRDRARIELQRLRYPGRAINDEHGSRGARTHVYEDVCVIDFVFDMNHGTQVALQFARPRANNQEAKSDRQEWWNASKRLGADALLCLVSSDGLAMFFLVAVQGKTATQLQAEYDLASDPEHAYIVARPVTQDDFHELLSRAYSNTLPVQQSLVEFPGVLLPSFEPTLRAMQRISENLDIPFQDILAPVSTVANPEREIGVQPPLYATKPGFKFDLTAVAGNTEAVSFAPSEGMASAIEHLRQNSSLDLGQADAVISSLARSLAVIQGPPGTGKSYTALQLIRILLANKKQADLGPLIMCTFSNHALDAILERCVDQGVERVVRIGGRSKSDRLADVNLQQLAYDVELTKTERSQRWKLKKQLADEAGETNSLLERFASASSVAAVTSFLRDRYRLHHTMLFGDDEDGFTMVGSPEKRLEWWLKTGPRIAGRPRPVDTLHDIDPHGMSFTERRALFDSWIVEIHEQLHEKLRHAIASYNGAKAQLDVIRTEVNLRVLRQANIIGLTTSGLARNLDLLQAVNARVLICEEAGEVMEAHMLTALLPSIEHCILIGDHQQLRPHVQNFDLSVESPRGGQYALDISLFERLVQPRDTFAQPLPFTTLNVQRRMHPSISQLVRKTQYPLLQDGGPVSEYPEVSGLRRRLFWVQHEAVEDGEASHQTTSRTNTHEADMILCLVKHLAQQGVYKAADIAVITPYLGQLRLLRNKFHRTHAIILDERDLSELEKEDANDPVATSVIKTADNSKAAKGSLNQALRLATVDTFQGDEARVIIVSLVRSNKTNSPGFLKTTNRINVLLSRAQHGMYIFGNTNTMQHVPMWNEVIKLLQAGGNVGTALELCCPRHKDKQMLVQSVTDFARMSPEAGCDLPCEQQLACGHACVAKCHSEMLHGSVVCLKACIRPKKGCKHTCPKPCGATCEEYCYVVDDNDATAELPCGHEKSGLACFEMQDPSLISCNTPVERTIPDCGHAVTIPCADDIDGEDFRCTAVCGAVLQCGHVCKQPCFRCRPRDDGTVNGTDHGKCRQTCDRSYSTCKHRCKASCHTGKPCPLCTQPCDTRCSHAQCGKLCSESCRPCLEETCSSGLHCPHREACRMPCAAPCAWLPCSKRCDKALACGCQCPSVCGEQCPDARFCQIHGDDDIKAMQADLLMFTPYGEINLDVDPCIFTSCGHIFTIDSLDGTMGMQDHYKTDPKTGEYTGLKQSVAPFSMEESKPCPECRGSLRDVARYGRIIRRSLLDQSAKKLTAWADHRQQELSEHLSSAEENLTKSLGFPRKPLQDIVLSDTLELRSVKRLKTGKRYMEICGLITELKEFTKQLSREEQPFQRVHDLVEAAHRRAVVPEEIKGFDFHSEEIQLREHLRASTLLVRGYHVLISDVMSVHDQTPVGSRGTIKLDLEILRQRCEELQAEAYGSKNTHQEAEAGILWARTAAMECSLAQKTVEDDDGEEARLRLDTLNESALERLVDAVALCERYAAAGLAHHNRLHRQSRHLVQGEYTSPLQSLEDEAAEVRRMLNEGLSTSDMRMVVTTMAGEFGSTGHWYRCVNGHLFTVGECGLPMQLARCPTCGAGVGGENHRPTEGVTIARDIEVQFGNMTI